MTARDVQVELTVGALVANEFALDRLSIVWGRSSLAEQPDTSTLTAVIDVDKAGWHVDALPIGLGTTVVVTATHEATEAQVFRGDIDNVVLRWDDATGHLHLALTADDALADLAQLHIGDVPWPEESAEDRSHRISDLIPTSVAVHVSWQSPGLGDLPERLWAVAPRDVDRQPALALLHELGDSTDAGVYVVAGPLIVNPRNPSKPLAPARQVLFHGLSLDHPGREFTEDPPGTWTVGPATSGAELTVSAGHLRADPEYRRTRDQLLTEVTVAYKDPEADPEADDPQVTLTRHTGTLYHRHRRTTVLTDPADATTLAERLMRRGVPIWHTETLTWDASDGGPADPEAALLALLESASRVGLSVLVEDLPAWVPAEAGFVFVEGGQIEYVTDALDEPDEHPGRWVVTMSVVPAVGIGRGISYAETLASYPDITYINLDPAVTYTDVLAVGDPTP